VIPGLPDRYLVLSTLGAGGAGIVYKAIDTSLKRPVAIKALGPRGPDRTGRALRAEALAAASLDHPYICRVYELIETPQQTLIVMEFVEGETLATTLQRGIPPLEATLAIGSEIAEGLEAAHAGGLVHRDIKPSNIMVTPHGHVKILDFGIAAAVPLAAAEPALAPGRGWREGAPAYMSPEQARGQEVTPKSDLFSLGVVLYQCLSGALPFEGRTPYEYVSNLLTVKPAPLGPRASDIPFAIVQLVERCLDKDPRWRPDSAADLARELQREIEAGARGAATASLARWSTPRMRRRTVTAAGVAVAVAAAFGLHAWVWAEPDAIDVPRESVPLVTSASAESDSKLSPDGRWVSFLSTRDGRSRVWLRPLAGGEARPLDVEGETFAHVWSPSGSRIAAYAAAGSEVAVHIVSALHGGAVERRVRLDARANPGVRLLRWIGDDIFLTSGSDSGQLLTRISLGDGSLEDVTPTLDLQLEWLDVNPDGTLVVISAVDAGQEDLWIADLGGTRARRLTNDAAFDRFPVWTGETVTFQSNRGGQIDLWQIDPESLRTRLVTSSEPTERPDSATGDGALITFQVNHDASRLWRTGGDGRSAPVTNESLSDFAPSAAQGGRMVAFQRQASSPSLGATLLDSQLFVARTNPAGALNVAPVVTAGFLPAVSRGGSEVAYFARSSSGSRFASLFVKDLTTAQVRQVSAQCPLPGFSLYPLDWVHQTLAWSVDRSLYFIEQSDEGALVRRFHSPDGTTTNVTGVLKSFVVDLYPSPDGERLAYLLYHDRAFQVRERVVATGQERLVHTWLDRAAPEFQLRGWTNSGGLVVVRRVARPESDGSLMQVFVLGRGGAARIASVPGAHSATARLAPSGAALFFTSSENAIHNIYAMALPGGHIRKVTSNELPGRMFSGIAPLDDGSVVYAVNERRQDIWLSRALTDRRR